MAVCEYHHSVLGNNKLLRHAAAQMNLVNVKQSETSHTQKSIYCMIPFTWRPRTGKTNFWWWKWELPLSQWEEVAMYRMGVGWLGRGTKNF